ncbi:hypothetical protein KP806_07315 [Paenibacillus sp. N4]|uniref:hypothetical protein n=1 Tax=Paenibacillus vietnamensis TaxID=2590547 RepID=UPI001CD18B77|nr:hypothetical protein [Paenibacillus vietnamensis]MCA0754855.1 hypothetical protein [Paenibacillus vietnamensis]
MIMFCGPKIKVQIERIDSMKESCRKVYIQGVKRSLSTSEEEPTWFEIKPDWYDSGIKDKDGVPHYRLRYWCQNDKCRNQGNQYVKLEDIEVECHNCGAMHKIRTALGKLDESGMPVADRYGNFFRADELV